MASSVLIIDDSETIRRQVSRALEGTELNVAEAGDGVEGLERLEAHSDIALIICDVNMPRKNGIEFLESAGQSVKSIPTLMLTTEGNPELIRRAKQLGAKGWIVKPFKPELLRAAVTKLAQTRKKAV